MLRLLPGNPTRTIKKLKAAGVEVPEGEFQAAADGLLIGSAYCYLTETGVESDLTFASRRHSLIITTHPDLGPGNMTYYGPGELVSPEARVPTDDVDLENLPWVFKVSVLLVDAPG